MNDDPWADLGARPTPVPLTGPNPRFQWVADWVRKGFYNPSFAREDLDGAIQHFGLDREAAARWATRNLTWRDGWEIRNRQRYSPPASHVIRDDWPTIPAPYLTEAERELARRGRARMPDLEEPRKVPR